MKTNLNKIILNFVTIFFLSGCHTFEHQNIFLDAIKKNQNVEIVHIKDKINKNKSNTINENKNSSKVDLAPIDIPKQKKKVKTVALNKQINFTKPKKIRLDMIKNWSETKLIREFGQSDFVKQEGQLKNLQYHLSNCFLDIFLKNYLCFLNFF